VRDEAAYKKLPADKRDYWEKGQNKDLTQAQRDKLADECSKAGKYNRKTKSYSDDFPRAKDGKVDHGAVLRNAKEYVHDKLSPARDVEGVSAPARGLGAMIDLDSSPENPAYPPDNPDGAGHKLSAPDWVCINQAEYLAAVMRCLGYPVREVNVKLTKWLDWLHLNQVDYQEAAIQVWFGGKWHFADPFHCIFDPACVLDSYSTFKRWLLYVWDGTTKPPDYLPVPNDGHAGGWKRESETGNDLQKRFYSLAPGAAAPNALVRSDGWHSAAVYSSDPAPHWIPGVVIAATSAEQGTPVEARLSLVDDQGRISDGVRREIPGADRSIGGTRIPFVKGLTSGQEEVPTRHAGEFVFVGTDSLLPAWDEIGTRTLSLLVHAPAGTAVPLSWSAAPGAFPAIVEALPTEVTPGPSGLAAVPIAVTIDPSDPTMHVLFDLLRCCNQCGRCSNCCCARCLDLRDYPIAEDFLLACEQRRAVWLAHRHKGMDIA
jgi:hypothetical protein